MPKTRVYEIAKQEAISNKELVAKIKGLGINISNHMSTLSADEVQRVKRALDKERQVNTVEKRLGSTVIRRRSKAKKPLVRKKAAPAQPEAQPPEAAAEVEAAEEARPTEAAVEPAPAEEAQPAEVEAAEEAKPAEAATEPEPTEEAEPAEEGTGQAKPAEAEAEQEPAAKQPTPKAPAEAEEAAEEAEPAEQPTPPAAEPAEGEAEAAKAEEKPAPAAPAEAEEKPSPAAGATPEAEPTEGKPAGKPKKEEVKLGPTGRRIELPGRKRTATPRVVITDLGERPGRFRREYTPRQQRRVGRFGSKQKGKRKPTRKAKQTAITTPAEHKRRIRMETAISVTDLARQMGIKSGQALKQLWSMGMTGITINTVLDFDSASLLAAEFGFEVENVAFREEELIQQQQDRDEDLEPRSPVVTVMGHVDHGKTSLLDKIRDADVANSEAGGITQHVGAYKVKTSTGDIVFIDTPGHEAFTQMRARGAQCTDLVILVVAADDGVMPQTKEAIEHSRDAGVPLVVAINKSDKADANPQKVRQELTTYELVAEEWGGDTLMVDVSAVTGQGIDQLLENVLLQSEMLELKANPKKGARGVVLEALLDKARGPVSTLLVQEGTLKQGSIVLAGEYYGKVRAMLDHRGNQVKEAGPSTPVRILGLDGVPESGENFYVIGDEKDAKRIIDHRREEKRKKELAESSSSAIRLDRIAEMIKEGKQKELKVVLKTDVQGTAEAIKDSVSKLTTEKVKVSVVLSGVGGITETDVTFAKAAGAIIVGFNVRPAGKAAQAAEKEQVEIRLYNVIYELLDDLKEVMRGLLPKDRLEKTVGHAEVRQTFTIPKVGTIAGCFVSDGKISRSSSVRLFREDVKIYQGRIGSLRRFKEDVREVEKGYECGLSIENYNDVKVGDVVEAFEIEEVAATLE